MSGLAERNVKLVYHLAKRYRQRNDYDDIVGSGMVGLCKAAKAFDESKGYKFSTLAARCITNEFNYYFRVKNRIPFMKSIDAPIKLPNSVLVDVKEILPSADPSPEQQWDQKETIYSLHKTLKHLDPRSRYLVMATYGIGCDRVFHRIAGERFELKHDRATKIIARALRKLNELIKREGVNSI